MTNAEEVLEQMQALQITVAQAHNDLFKGKSGSDISDVDGVYKFYYCPDGSKLGCRIRSEPHKGRYKPKDQQVWIA